MRGRQFRFSAVLRHNLQQSFTKILILLLDVNKFGRL